MEKKADDAREAPKLSEIFEDSWRIKQELDNVDKPTNSKSYQDTLQKAIKMLEQATVMVSQLNLFSSNEQLEELPTTDIRYLLLPALLGCLSLKVTEEDRLTVVERSKTYFIDFLRRCRQYGVTEEEIPEDPEPRPHPPKGRPDLMAMQANREDKIRRYKEAKEMEKRMKALGAHAEMRNKPEDVQREYYVLCLKKWVGTALEELAGIQQEMEILHHMARMKSRQEQGTNAEPEPPKEKPRQPMKPFILTRDAIQAQVFGAGYPSVPTMTLEEFYQKEIAEGKILPNSQNPTPVSQREEAERKEQEKEEAIERDDPEALRKAREWDDFKDTHKRGCGNRENMG
ncbi:immunoglobulin-binding protein 1-like [Acanthaster planci]|uniref:Immunoglobulin-binding protein 1-like n=1 Tax=Acanthaster planci TaxID=133434 RepID=A0A8B7Y9N2_ACAPL|nr:immunoglobulin-binding protein 1-like [Acanthaster planci]